MNKTQRKDAEYHRGRNTDWSNPKKHSAKWRRKEDIDKYGFHISDHAVLRYLERILEEPIPRYRYERIVPNDSIAKEIKGWFSKDDTKRINVKNYQLRVKDRTVCTIVDLDD